MNVNSLTCESQSVLGLTDPGGGGPGCLLLAWAQGLDLGLGLSLGWLAEFLQRGKLVAPSMSPHHGPETQGSSRTEQEPRPLGNRSATASDLGLGFLCVMLPHLLVPGRSAISWAGFSSNRVRVRQRLNQLTANSQQVRNLASDLTSRVSL